MARITAPALLSGPNLEIPVDSTVELVGPTDNGLSWFKAKWRDGKGNEYTGQLASRVLEFTDAEIEEHQVCLGADDLPLYRDLEVIYSGESNDAVSKGDLLIVRDPWYNAEDMECQCVHRGNARPNTDGRVVVKCNLLRRR